MDEINDKVKVNVNLNDNVMLIHKPIYNTRFVYTISKVTSITKTRTKYDYLGPTSAGGSSGSPLFAQAKETRTIGIYGLHKAKNTCINMSAIIQQLNNN